MPGKRRLGRREEGGAAAVEFALVSAIFLTMVIGMIQYGMYFTDSINVRQGVREGARMGVVKNFPTCDAASTEWDTMRCNTRSQVGSLTGPTFVRVEAPEGWTRGEPLIVCAQVDTSNALDFLPMPNGGVARSKTEMSIEKEGAPSGAAGADALPAGLDWAWCA